ncbi:MAG: type I-B CRISPR-associated protein Cas8b1/Cst1 [Stygiobacter sp.]
MSKKINIKTDNAYKEQELLRLYLGDWLYNAGLLGFLKIILHGNSLEEQKLVRIKENYIEFTRDVFEGFTDKFFETAFKFHGKFDSIKSYLNELKIRLENTTANEELTKFAKEFKVKNDEEIISGILAEKIGRRWKGIIYESFNKIKKSDFTTLESIKNLLDKLIGIQNVNREVFVEKEVKTYLSNILGQRSFLNRAVSQGQKKTFYKDFEHPLLNSENKAEEINCLHCGLYHAKKNTIFNSGLVKYQGLNQDSINFVWNFNPNLPICEFCEIVYFCHWAGFTKGFYDKTFLFVNDDSSVENLLRNNQLLQRILEKDKSSNVLIEYFYQLLEREENITSDFVLQNISIIEVNLEKEIMPKIYSLHIPKKKASFIKTNHPKLQQLAKKNYHIKDVSQNLLEEFLNGFLNERIGFSFINKITKYYMLSKDATKSNLYKAYYNSFDIQSLLILIKDYLEKIKQKDLDMNTKTIWHIYHLGNELKTELTNRNAENKINGIAFRLLNSVRANDVSTFLNVILRLYMSYDKEVPKVLVNTLSGSEQFQVIGHSFINGLLGESIKAENKQ